MSDSPFFSAMESIRLLNTAPYKSNQEPQAAAKLKLDDNVLRGRHDYQHHSDRIGRPASFKRSSNPPAKVNWWELRNPGACS